MDKKMEKLMKAATVAYFQDSNHLIPGTVRIAVNLHEGTISTPYLLEGTMHGKARQNAFRLILRRAKLALLKNKGLNGVMKIRIVFDHALESPMLTEELSA
jgi:hypothetical protein